MGANFMNSYEYDTITQQIEILQDENVSEMQAISALKEQIQLNVFKELYRDL